MAISLDSIKTGVSDDPPIITIFGDGGVGKTTFCANAPNPIFIFTEKSLGKLDVPRFTFNDEDGSERYIASSFEEVMQSLEQLLGNHNYQTLVIDSLDWLEPLVENYLLRIRPTTDKGRPVKNIKDYGYGTGESFIIDCWSEYFSLISEIQKKKDMIVIQTAHCAITKVTPPDTDAYTTYSIKLDNKKAREKVIEGSDAVLYFTTKHGMTKEDIGFNQTRNRAVGGGEKYVYTEDRAAHDGKNKYSLPYEIPVRQKDWQDVWGILAQNIPWFNQFDEKPQEKVIPVKQQVAKVIEEKQGQPVDAEPVIQPAPKFFNKAK